MKAVAEPFSVRDDFWQLLDAELDKWPAYGSRACIHTAVQDYDFLLGRNRRLGVLCSSSHRLLTSLQVLKVVGGAQHCSLYFQMSLKHADCTGVGG